MGVEIIDLGKLSQVEAQKKLQEIQHDTITSAASVEVRENLSKLMELNSFSVFEVDEVGILIFFSL